MDLIRGISGIRGIVDQSLNDSVIISHVQAFSRIQNDGVILLARDSRKHGEALISTAAKALRNCGREVINYNIIPTPTAQFLVEKKGYAGGIVITASHNPTEWNGLKFIDFDGCFLNAQKNNQLFEIADTNQIKEVQNGSIQEVQNGYLSHVAHTRSLNIIDSRSIENRKFTIVIDAVNGAASKALPSMVESLGCVVHKIYCNPDGNFPRGAEPLPHNLIDLGNAVREYGADAGFATDPDGDRLAIVDENGQPIGEEYTLTICADGYYKVNPTSTSMVTNLSSTMALDKIAEKYGKKVIRSAVGEINVVNKMKEESLDFGGEGNGGVILPDSHYGRDSLVGAAMFLNRMAQDDKTVSEIFKSMPQYIILKDKIALGKIEPQSVLDKIESKYEQVKIDKSDGLKIIWENSWVHVRKSNTEPIIRIYAEANTKSEASLIIQDVKDIIG
mgnify:CR=1 FL=1